MPSSSGCYTIQKPTRRWFALLPLTLQYKKPVNSLMLSQSLKNTPMALQLVTSFTYYLILKA